MGHSLVPVVEHSLVLVLVKVVAKDSLPDQEAEDEVDCKAVVARKEVVVEDV